MFNVGHFNSNRGSQIFFLTDTHFGHKNIVKYCGRPQDYEDQIFAGIESLHLTVDDILIHMGDVALGDADRWNRRIVNTIRPAKSVLLLGNHDRTYTWHKARGWTIVSDGAVIQADHARPYEAAVTSQFLFTHEPYYAKDHPALLHPRQPMPPVFDVNVHGHQHNRVPKNWTKASPYMLYALEYEGYTPKPLNYFVEGWRDAPGEAPATPNNPFVTTLRSSRSGESIQLVTGDRISFSSS